MMTRAACSAMAGWWTSARRWAIWLRSPAQWRMEAVIEGFDEYRPQFERLAESERGVLADSVRLRAPLPRPRHLLCAFANYLDREGAQRGNIDFFYKGATSVVGTGTTIEVPDLEGATAYQPEPEFAYVIGMEAKHVAEADAMDYVFGYVNFIDVSCRGLQGRRTTFLHKGIDDWGPMGPAIVTKDEIPDPQDVRVRLWLNEELQQNYSTSAMAYPRRRADRVAQPVRHPHARRRRRVRHAP